MRALLNRTSHTPDEMTEAEIRCGPLLIDLARRRVKRRNEVVHLTRTEFSVLQELAIHRNKVLTHSHLLSAVWGAAYRDDLDYLRAYIRYLRKKLETDPSAPQMIVTVQGVGYMLECGDQES